MFHKKSEEKIFDRSSKIYSSILLTLTALIAGLTAFGHQILWRVVGGILIAIFVAYVLSIAWTVYKGRLSAPELSDSDSDSDSSDDEVDAEASQQSHGTVRAAQTDNLQEIRPAEDETQSPNSTATINTTEQCPVPHSEMTTIGTTQSLQNQEESPPVVPLEPTSTGDSGRSKDHSLAYHVGLLSLGAFAIVLSAYVLSHAATTLVGQFGISDVLFGVVILSIATTVPEKFIAVVSGSRGQTGIMVANTVGSNIFLLSLCMGILWVSTGGAYNEGSVKPAEIGVMLGSALALFLAVWFGAKWVHAIGAVMLVAYIAFLILEFTIIHKV